MSQYAVDLLDELASGVAGPSTDRTHRPQPLPALESPVRVGTSPTPVGASVLDVLSGRTSIRDFADAPIQAADVLDALTVALDADSTTAGPDAAPFEITLLAVRMGPLAPGIYRFSRTERTTELIAPLPPEDRLRDLTLQQEFSYAPVLVSVAADLQDVATRDGAAGYRELMTRAGAVLYRTWLEGIARGLIGSVFAGFIPATVRTSLRSDGASRHQLFALALGAPRTAVG
ncbi:nitroreductase family protein [Cryptosporangium minutisporangium]|uniref:Nitroreductase domain-containing protein n=1 Tax=Cryptosporangium minutisporangium TaxID=113569 RepID=A0ABP6T0M8_9ACTN